MINPAHSVVYLSIRRDKIELAVGTGVLYEKDNETYIVTAWHNISGRHTETLSLLSRKLAVPNNVVASIAVKTKKEGHIGFIRIHIRIPLVENEQTTYYIHEQGYPKVDVVAIPIDLEKEYLMEVEIASGESIKLPIQLKSKHPNSLERNIISIQDCEFKIKEIDNYEDYLYVSDDIFIIGYPKGITDYTMQPIWKRATIATAPHLGWKQQEQFLVDCASKQGMSGAPAIYYNRDGKINTGDIYSQGSQPISILHGIYVGRIGSTSELEAQIGKVWKRKVIDEIIDSKIYDFLSEELILSNSDIEKIIKKKWPTEDKEYSTKLLDEKTAYRYIFMHLIMKEINGRANKDNVLNLILKYAKDLSNKVDR